MGSTGEAVNLEIELVSGGGGDTIGALIIRIGCWGADHTIIIKRNLQNSRGNY